MIVINRYLGNRYVSFLLACLLCYGMLHTLYLKTESIAPTLSPLIFPTLTIFLLVFHLFIAFFMLMKYWCEKNRVFLLAIAFAFAGSAVLMLGTLSSFPAWLTSFGLHRINYNDAMIFFMFRNVMMAFLITCAAVLYTLRHHVLPRRVHVIIIVCLFLFTVLMITLAWIYSSHSTLLSIDLVSNDTRQMTILWNQVINLILIIFWVITLITMLVITRLRNVFWVSGSFLCVCYMITLVTLFASDCVGGFAWYSSRLFETTATLLIIFSLLHDVFSLYRDSHLKYQQSYQNSIRDALTRLYNRSYFYESLNQLLRTTSASKPVSVVVSDLDRFKRINDTYGHLQGDNVLQFVANLLMDSVRPQDIAARIGGEEFVLLLANTPAEAARQVAERIRILLSSFDRESTHGQLPEPITISMGVYTATSSAVTAEECVERADKAMYEAKETGRNRVVVYR